MKKTTKKILAILMTAAIALTLAACGAGAAAPGGKPVAETSPATEEPKAELNYPDGNLKITVPLKTGSAGDLIVRLVAKYLKDEIGENVIVENIAGGGGAVAMTEYLNEKPNTTTITSVGHALYTLNPIFDGEEKYSLNDIIPIISIDAQERILFVNKAKTGIDSLDALFEYGKENFIPFASGSEKNDFYLIMKGMFDERGIESDFVQNDSAQEGLTNLLGGHVVCAIAAPSLGEQFVKEGSLVPLAVFSDEPYTGYEGVTVPTAKSLGVDVLSSGFRFFGIRAGTDQAIVDYLYNAILNVYNNPEFIKEAEALDAAPLQLDGTGCIDQMERMRNRYEELYHEIYG